MTIEAIFLYGSWARGDPSLSLLRAFLDAETLTDPLGSDASEISWRRHFDASCNVVALQLLKVRDESALLWPYA
ncbi:hypothetical protein [Rhizobiales bacterium]|jgi:hypothetical protein